MNRLARVTSIIAMLMILVGCTSVSDENDVEDKEPKVMDKSQEMVYSENILLSLNHGAPGFGTQAECTDAEIFIYTDRNVRVVVYYPEELEIASFEISKDDYDALYELADREQIRKLRVKDGEGCDGSSYYISLYDENDTRVLSKGGYMPEGEKFWEVYHGIHDILKSYGITESVVEYRKSIED